VWPINCAGTEYVFKSPRVSPPTPASKCPVDFGLGTMVAVTRFECFPVRVAGDDLRSSLWLHPGTEPARHAEDGGEPYEPSAYLPVFERRRLSPAELRAVSSQWHWPSSHCVSTFRIDARVVDEMRHLGVHPAVAPGSAASSAEGHRLWNLLCKSAPLSSAGCPFWLGLSERPSGLRTSTFDVSTNRRLGLHLDSWDRTALHQRHTARVRLCVNLGRRSRSLLFLPYDIGMVAAALEADGPLPPGTNLGARFCAAFPDVPVFESVVAAGCAYLAPTDNLIHDGCSEASDEPDLTIAWLGLIGYLAALG
jgi:hypothetical protein